jgi:anthranilate synthase component 2
MDGDPAPRSTGGAPAPSGRPRGEGAGARVVLVDNYDSFTYNLVQYLAELGAEVLVYRHDAIGVEEIATLRPTHLVISPGPKTPDEAGISVEAIRRFAGVVPVLGVCLGHQAIGRAFGGRIVRGGEPVHGKTSEIRHAGGALFEGIENPLIATRYHSLVIDPDLPPQLILTAWCAGTAGEGDVVMGVRHRDVPVEGVQFHPESILTTSGKRLLANFLAMSA